MDSTLGHHLVDVKIKNKSLSLSEVAVVGRAVAKALQVMHGLGTMHRDLCPDNILVRVDELGKIVECKVADFGVAHHKDNTPTDIGGKDQWRAPEKSTPESDIFSFGLVRYSLAIAAALQTSYLY
jgi:serine/threonine-protein kinase